MKRTRWVVALTGAGMVAAALTAGTAMAAGGNGGQQGNHGQPGGNGGQQGNNGQHGWKTPPAPVKKKKDCHKGDPKVKGGHKAGDLGDHDADDAASNEGGRGGDAHHSEWVNGLSYSDPGSQSKGDPRKTDPCSVKPLDLQALQGPKGGRTVVLHFPQNGCQKEQHGKAVLWTSTDDKHWTKAGTQDPGKDGAYRFDWKNKRGEYVKAEIPGTHGGHTCDSMPMFIH